MGGSLHVALGRAYPQCGGTNVSAIHLDLIKDMRADGRVLLDGAVIYERGEFLV
jgi:aminopeptidase